MNLCMLNCCAIREMAGIGVDGGPEATLTALINQLQFKSYKSMGCAFYVFSQAGVVDGRGYGDKLKAYIEAEGLGEVNVVGTRTNPNSHRNVKMFVWMPDLPAFKKWASSR